jgi:hypothetical protein
VVPVWDPEDLLSAMCPPSSRELWIERRKLCWEDKNGQVEFAAIKETGKLKIKSRLQSKKNKGIRTKSASSSRSRSREKMQPKKKKAAKEEKAQKAEGNSSDEEPDVSEIVLSKPKVKNISMEGVLPGYLQFFFILYLYFKCSTMTFT